MVMPTMVTNIEATTKMSSYLFQHTLSRRYGTGDFDYRFIWWDDLEINGIVTSFVRLDILHDGTAMRLLELELNSGEGGSALKDLATHLLLDKMAATVADDIFR